ncbi:ligand-gated ion channel [Aquariibacter albus]|uniref:Neurotransmitter-gated ion-channel ligand-binding domain-containing protein n=1 Tax=Aquariibacter albus TaxID=2759899 RepID=A0A839HK53_9BURK|nr:hypothetical protein [Aquariibacter albus]MBB1163177.1 hypothetical protein [Aquariibacter albus]
MHRRFASWGFRLLHLLSLLALGTALSAAPARASPSEVVVGAYINKIQDLNFRENKYALDFYLWFRWKGEGRLADYKPLESFEIINGKIEDKSSVVEKRIGDTNYASVRVSATISESWDLTHFPFDRHTLGVFIEDSVFTLNDVVFVPDTKNSSLGDELDLPGWRASNFASDVRTKIYRTNYGDTSLPADAKSEYSRFAFMADIDRLSQGSAIKLLSTVLLATAVAFVAFMVKPSDLDARFGMGVGSLFAVAASAFIAASAVPDSGEMTIADKLHMVALGFIFVTLLISSLCLKFEVRGREDLALTIDRICLVLLPLAFYGWAGWLILSRPQ